MEEDRQYPGEGPGLRAGRRIWLQASVIALAAAITLILLLVLPASNSGVDQAGPVEERPAEEAVGEQPAAPPGQDGGQGATVVPGGGGNAPDLVVQFPNPAVGVNTGPPRGGYQDVSGQWVMEMSGSNYGLQNCYLSLEESGAITAPGDYDYVFQIMGSEYRWEQGDPAFNATLQLAVKMGSNQTLIPVKVELSGQVSGSLSEIEGDFTATPQGNAYAVYAQQGRFKMHR